MISLLLSKLENSSLPDYLLAPVDEGAFRAFVNTTRLMLATMSFPGAATHEKDIS
jgi:hypothetical protein